MVEGEAASKRFGKRDGRVLRQGVRELGAIASVHHIETNFVAYSHSDVDVVVGIENVQLTGDSCCTRC